MIRKMLSSVDSMINHGCVVVSFVKYYLYTYESKFCEHYVYLGNTVCEAYCTYPIDVNMSETC